MVQVVVVKYDVITLAVIGVTITAILTILRLILTIVINPITTTNPIIIITIRFLITITTINLITINLTITLITTTIRPIIISPIAITLLHLYLLLYLSRTHSLPTITTIASCD